MTIEKWKELIGNIKDNFEVINEGSESDEESGGTDTEFIIFKGPMGKVKLELVTRPVVLDKKTIYSNRIGAETKVEYVYSEDEKSVKMKAYLFNDNEDDWAEIDSSSFKRDA